MTDGVHAIRCSRCGRQSQSHQSFVDPLTHKRMRLYECSGCGKVDTRVSDGPAGTRAPAANGSSTKTVP